MSDSSPLGEPTLGEAQSGENSLYDKIHDLSIGNYSDKKFVPENSLKALFSNKSSDAAQFRSHVAKSLPEDSDTDAIVRFIREKAPKIYATLIYSEREHLIVHFLKCKFDDSMLPVMMEGEQMTSFPARARLDLAKEAVELADKDTSKAKLASEKHQPNPIDTAKIEEAKAAAWAARRDVEEAKEALKVAEAKMQRAFRPQSLRDRNRFFDTHQWLFVSPVFREGQFSYSFHKKAQMPFWPASFEPKDGKFSSVTRRQIDRNHLPQNDNKKLHSTDAGHPWVTVAEKKIRRGNQSDLDFQEMYQFEAKALKVMKSLDDCHLIRAVASYRRGNYRYFLFPWAGLGSLRDYWDESKGCSPLSLDGRLAPQYLQWVFTQLVGVAHAIKLLHEKRIVHGDLKPENILCFPNSADEPEKGRCTLVIADAGLSKIHNLTTHLRTKKTEGPEGLTVTYAPPQVETQADERTSRRFDIWSMGCICLEFLVWIVKGHSGLNSFSDSLALVPGIPGKFYELKYNKKGERRVIDAKLNAGVVKEIKTLRKEKIIQGADNPLKRLVDIIETKMLKPHLDLDTINNPAADQDVRVTSDIIFLELRGILEGKNFSSPSAALDGSEVIQPSTTQEAKESALGEGFDASAANGPVASGKSSRGFRAWWRESLGVRRSRRR